MFTLFGVISPYDGSELLGVFDSLEKAIQARSQFREEKIKLYTSDPFEFYEIYESPLNTLSENIRSVDTFKPSKTKQRKNR